jgi:hypothetical protein
MKILNYTAKKGIENKLTIKGRTGSYKSTGDTHEVCITFELSDGEQLREENEITKEANDKVKQALKDLMNPDPDWIDNNETETTHKGYTESR